MAGQAKRTQIVQVVATAFRDGNHVIGIPPRLTAPPRWNVPRPCECGALVFGERRICAPERATVGPAEHADAAIAFGDPRPQATPCGGIPIRVRARIRAPHATTNADLALTP